MASATNSEIIQADVEFLGNLKDCIIDKEGLTFKYILIKVEPNKVKTRSESHATKVLVRGFENCLYHCDIFDEVEKNEKIFGDRFQMTCLGGGRIRHYHKQLHIYGYSQGYGKADHEITKSLLQKEYPTYKITCSDEGY